MAVDKIYRPRGMQFETTDISPLKSLGGLTSANVGDNPNIVMEYTDGGIDVTRISKRGSEESIVVTTENPDDAIDIVGGRFLCQKGTPIQAGVKLFMQEVTQCDTGPGADNIEYQIANHPTDANDVVSMITAESLNCEHGGSAEFSLRATPKSVNGNAGTVMTSGVALPAISDNQHRYGLSKFVVDGVNLTGKKSINCAFNVTVQTESADGVLRPEHVFVDQIGTLITVRGINPKWLGNSIIPRAGKAFAHVNSDFYLARYLDDGTEGFEPDASAVHIAGSMNGLAFITQLAGGRGRASAETVLGIWLKHDGVNVPLVLNTGQIIP